jgi:hypothetical protein
MHLPVSDTCLVTMHAAHVLIWVRASTSTAMNVSRVTFIAAEEIIGPRAFRVIFALVSLPLAVVAVVYWINHRCSVLLKWCLHSAVSSGKHG